MAAYLRHSDPEALRIKARDLYQSGVKVKDICKALHICTRSVQTWCADLIAAKRLEISKRSRNPKPDDFAGYTPLTDEIVIATRRAVRESGKKNWKLYAGLHNTSMQHISDAMRGLTFAHIDAIEPPIQDHEVKRHGVCRGGKRKPPMTKALVAELAKLRRDDPVTWTFQKLAALAQERTGKNHQASTTARTIHRFDPSLKEPAKVRIPRVKLTPEEVRERKRALSRRYYRIIRDEDLYERFVAQNGLP